MDVIETNAEVGPEDFSARHRSTVRRARWLPLAVAFLVLAFVKPLRDLLHLSFENNLYSHVPLIPIISLYLAMQMRRELPRESAPSPWAGIFALGGGIVLAGIYWLGVGSGWQLAQTDYLSIMTLAFLLCFYGACFVLIGRQTMRVLAFPAAFLLFMVPFPVVVERGLETLLQHGSAEAAYALLKLSGTTVFREGTVFVLPGISLEVAPECSGIRSSLVLIITSLLAGHIFLRSGWAKALLAAAVIPLGIFRNAFRIFVLAQLCVHVSPDMIDSPIHHKGGPVFFVISLVPLFLLLVWLRRRELRRGNREPSNG